MSRPRAPAQDAGAARIPAHAVRRGPGGVRIDTLAVKGGLALAVVQPVIRDQMEALWRCYAAGLRAHPALAGSLLISLRLDATGSVAKVATLAGSLAHEATERCLRSVLAAARFPEPRSAPTLVRLKLVFLPGSSA